jgi:hypothetical protein
MGIQSERYCLYYIQSGQINARQCCLFYWFHHLVANSSSLARQTTATTLDTPKNIQPPEALTGGKNLTYVRSDVQ